MIYYVYAYLDPRRNYNSFFENLTFNNEPIYIGCGSGTRMFHHLQDALAKKPDKNLLKYNLLRKIIEGGQLPIITKLVEFQSQDEAFAFEIKLIKAIGSRVKIEGIPFGTLTNLRAGGRGGKHTTESKEKLRQKALITSPITNRNPITREKLRQSTKAALARNPDWAARFKIAAAAAIRKYNADPVNREKISARLKGIPRSKEVIEKCKLNASKHFSNSAWMNNGEIIKRIPFDEIQVYLESGWIKGRKIT